MSTQTEKGVTMLEIAISIPLFLAIIFFVIWIAVTTHARNSLHASVANAVRMAYSRGDQFRAGALPGNLLSKVQSSMSGGFTPHPDTVPLLKQNVSANVFADGEWYMNSWSEGFGLVKNPSTGDLLLPPKYIMAIMYAHEGLRKRTGGKLKYPCDPYSPNAEDGPGCLRCRNLNPMALLDFRYAPSSKGICAPGQTYEPPQNIRNPNSYVAARCSGSAIGSIPSPSNPGPSNTFPYISPGFNSDFVGLHCEYMPDNLLLRPIYAMLRILGVHNSEEIAPVFEYTAFYGSTTAPAEGVWQ